MSACPNMMMHVHTWPLFTLLCPRRQVVTLLDRLCEFARSPPKNTTFLPILGNHDLAFLLANDPSSFRAQRHDWFRRWTGRYMNLDVPPTPVQYTKTAQLDRDAFRGVLAGTKSHHVAFLSSLPWYRVRRIASRCRATFSTSSLTGCVTAAGQASVRTCGSASRGRRATACRTAA